MQSTRAFTFLASSMSEILLMPAMPWLQALENRTLDSKREMDIMNALDEMKSLKSRQEKVDSNALLAALQRSADDDRAALAAEDEAAVRSRTFHAPFEFNGGWVCVL